MKQTAIEWLVEQYIEKLTITPSMVEQAKSMEKEQIIEAVDCCLSSIQLSEDKNSFIALSAEQYYNERFVLKTI